MSRLERWSILIVCWALFACSVYVAVHVKEGLVCPKIGCR